MTVEAPHLRGRALQDGNVYGSLYTRPPTCYLHFDNYYQLLSISNYNPTVGEGGEFKLMCTVFLLAG